MWEISSEIFNWVIRGSLYAVAVVFIIVIAQTLTRRMLPARWCYALWLILLVRLVLPAGTGPETNWSLWNLATLERWSNTTASDSGGQDAAGAIILQAAPGAGIGDQGNPTRITGKFFPSGITHTLFVIWLAGVLVMIAAAAFVNLRLWNSVRGLDFTTDSGLLELFEDCKRRMRVKTMAGLVVTDRVENPFLFGFIRPRVILPAGLARQLSTDQLRCVLLHELAHLKRGDIVTGWLLAFLQSLHWFNPIVWWAFYRMRFDRETACDALVLSRMSDGTRFQYGDTLIDIMERFNQPRYHPAIVAGIIENKKQLKRRFNMITNFRHPRRGEIIAAGALLAVLSIALLTEPRTLLSQQDELIADAVVVPIGEFRIIQQADVGREQLFVGEMTDDMRSHLEQLLSQLEEQQTNVGEFRIIQQADDMRSRLEQLLSQLEEQQTNEVASAGTPNFISIRKMPDGTIVGVDSRIINPGDIISIRGMEIHALDDGRVNLQLSSELSEQVSDSVSGEDTLNDFHLPQILSNPRPDYTEEAREAGIEGVIRLQATIRGDGVVDNVIVLHGLGYGLDEAAIDTVTNRWRFRPATLDGVPVDHTATIEISFHLL
jgi:TonB family protein